VSLIERLLTVIETIKALDQAPDLEQPGSRTRMKLLALNAELDETRALLARDYLTPLGLQWPEAGEANPGRAFEAAARTCEDQAERLRASGDLAGARKASASAAAVRRLFVEAEQMRAEKAGFEGILDRSVH
jgi:hypothetical protein